MNFDNQCIITGIWKLNQCVFWRFIQGGSLFDGPFDGYYPTADVRVRVWRMCDFPAADFKSANEHTVSVSGIRIF